MRTCKGFLTSLLEPIDTEIIDEGAIEMIRAAFKKNESDWKNCKKSLKKYENFKDSLDADIFDMEQDLKKRKSKLDEKEVKEIQKEINDSKEVKNMCVKCINQLRK